MNFLKRLASVATLTLSLSGVVTPVMAAETFDVLRSYYDVDNHLPLELKVVDEFERNQRHVTDFTFLAFDNEKVRARLELPDASRYYGKRPVVILLHGITQSLDQWWREDQGPYSFPAAHREILVENGFAVLAIDLRNHGERRQPNDFEFPAEYLEKGYYEAARKMISQSAIDVRRAIDTISHFETLDPDRVAVVGFSLGAWTGYIASAVDTRVKTAVLIGMPFLPPAEGNATHFISQLEYSDGFARRPVHFIAGTEDHFYSRGEVDRLMQRLADDASVSWIESGHDFPRSTATMTLERLQRGM